LSTTARVLIGLALGILAGAPSTLAGDDFAARLAAIVSPSARCGSTPFA